MKPHCFTRRADGLPRIEHDDGDAIRGAFFNLAAGMSARDPDVQRVKTWFRDKVPEVVKRPQWGSYRRWVCTALFEPAHAKLLGELYARVEAGMARAYLEGKHDGSHLLSRLAKGEVTPATFDEEREQL